MEGAARTLVTKFGLLVGEEFQKLRGVGGEVAHLRDELATMNALLRMQSEAEQGAVDHFLREWMKQLRELAYDAEDCIDLYFLRIRCRPGGGFLVWSKLPCNASASPSPRGRYLSGPSAPVLPPSTSSMLVTASASSR
jgi:hypothetical protein